MLARSFTFALASLVGVLGAPRVHAQSVGARYLALEVTEARGILAFEVTVDGSEMRICRAEMFGCHALTDEERAATTITRSADGAPAALGFVSDGTPGTITLEPALPYAAAIVSEIALQCLYAGEAGESLDECTSERHLREVLGPASRILAAIADVRSPFELTDAARHTSGGIDPLFVDAASMATVDALDHRRSSTVLALRRLVRRGLLRLRDGTNTVPDRPAALEAALDRARAGWIEEAERDHGCDSTCGGCIELSDRDFGAERRLLPAALVSFATALDDALWARGVSIWTLDDAEARLLAREITRSGPEVACMRSDWRHASFRRCIEAWLVGEAAAAVAAWPGR